MEEQFKQGVLNKIVSNILVLITVLLIGFTHLSLSIDKSVESTLLLVICSSLILWRFRLKIKIMRAIFVLSLAVFISIFTVILPASDFGIKPGGSLLYPSKQEPIKNLKSIWLKVRPSNAKYEYKLGEPIDLTLTIENFYTTKTILHPSSCTLKVEIYRPWYLLWGRNRRVRRTSAIYSRSIWLLREGDFVRLKAGEKITQNIRFPTSWEGQCGLTQGLWVEPSLIGFIIGRKPRTDILKECFSQVGRYTIKVSLESDATYFSDRFVFSKDEFNKLGVDKDKIVTGKISSGELRIRIKKPVVFY